MTTNDRPRQSVMHCNLLKFQCDQNWDSLTETRDPRIRFCEHCKEAVYLCLSEAEFREHAANHHCVALAAAVWSGGNSQTGALALTKLAVGTPFEGPAGYFERRRHTE